MRQQYPTQMPRVQALPLFEADTCPCGFTIASLRAVLKREQRILSEWKHTVPIKLSVATKALTVGFNMLHAKCKGRINQTMRCPQCEEPITRADTVKGFEVSKDKYVIITADELEACEPESNKVMEITATVPANDAFNPN